MPSSCINFAWLAQGEGINNLRMRFMHDNTEISKNVIIAAVPPSSNATNGCTVADIVVDLKTSSASYSSRSLALSAPVFAQCQIRYSRTTAGLKCTALTRAREPQRQLSKPDDRESGYISGQDVDATTAFLN